MPGSAMRLEEAWRVLGLPARPPLHAIKAAYRRLAKSTHPDAIGGAKSAALRFARICRGGTLAYSRPGNAIDDLVLELANEVHREVSLACAFGAYQINKGKAAR